MLTVHGWSSKVGKWPFKQHVYKGTKPIVWELLKSFIKGKKIDIVHSSNPGGHIPLLVRLGLLGKVYYPKHIVSPVHAVGAGSASFIERLITSSWYVSPNAYPLLGIALPIVAGYAGGKIAGMAFRAGADALDKTNATAEHIRALEFGGTLGTGYMSQEAATERQRGVSANNRTHLGSRKGLTLEAQNYAALV